MKYQVNGADWSPEAAEGYSVEEFGNRLRIRGPEGSWSALAVRSGDNVLISYRGRTYTVERVSSGGGATGGAGAGAPIAPMPGQIIEVYVSAGDEIKVGEKLGVLEAMKMQQQIVSGLDGIVEAVNVAVGDQVQEGQTLFEIKAEGSDEG